MNHYYQNLKPIVSLNEEHGWFNYPNLYKLMVNKFKNDSHFIEIGSWQGCSSIFMAVEIINSKKQIKFDCIDTWEGSPEIENPWIKDFLKSKNDQLWLYNTFLKNIEPVKHIINPIKSISWEAANMYNNNSIDFIFFDASHSYESTKKDLHAWYDKIKVNGILAGHDYNSDWSGVVTAVNEFFGSKNIILFDNCWVYKKNK